ncbi:hypothetical protein [Vibrio harveyi]|uniref:hypothetical protein n=1 Tax=Vibrio harveyi TaxID=669 RepID=UPI00237D48D6|nr:hypothetical protein [Vibrio harveyi]HDM8054647.1 hypothetical protein [Vibrio harveyi]
MYIKQFVKNANPRKDGELDAVKQANIYYVSEGRNAWHSTYTRRFTTQCMHPTLESAQEYCESVRTQGTKFHIDVLPALVFYTSHRTLLVTEINTETPLARFDTGAFLSNSKVTESTKKTLKWRTTMSTLCDSFDPHTGSWELSSKHEHSVILLDGTSIKFEIADSKHGRKYQSYSVGGNQSLGWSQFESQITRGGVRKIWRMFNRKK